MIVTIKYPNASMELEDQLQAAGHGARAVLKQHAVFLPLAPGDIVTIRGGDQVTGVEWLAPLCTIDVSFYVPADVPAFHTPTPEHRSMKAVERVLEEWRTTLAVTRTTNFNALVSAPSMEQLEEVRSHQYVEWSEVIREPGMPFDFEFAIKSADVSYEGPWA